MNRAGLSSTAVNVTAVSTEMSRLFLDEVRSATSSIGWACGATAEMAPLERAAPRCHSDEGIAQLTKAASLTPVARL